MFLHALKVQRTIKKRKLFLKTRQILIVCSLKQGNIKGPLSLTKFPSKFFPLPSLFLLSFSMRVYRVHISVGSISPRDKDY